MLSGLSPRSAYRRAHHVTRQRSLSRLLYVLTLTLCLTSWLFTDVTGNMRVASAATIASPKLPISGVSYTLQQFLKQGKPYKASDKPLVLPSRSYISSPISKASSSNGSTLPSVQPATMKAVSQSISKSFLQSPIVPGSLASNTTGVSGSASPLHIVGSDASGVRLEVVIPAGALDLSHATITSGRTPTGTLTFSLAQLSGHFAGATSELGSF